jgi:tetratricopeptide (TPR) repeat protein
MRPTDRTSRIPLFFFVGVFFLCSGAALADDLIDCSNIANADIAIPACTRLITSRQMTGRDLALIYANRGWAWKRKGEAGKALSDLNQSLKIFPDPSNKSYYGRGVIRQGMQDYDGALSDYATVLRSTPGHIGALINHGVSSFASGKISQAIEDYTTLIRIAPDFLPAYVSRAIAYEKQGDRLKAIEDFKAALAIPEQSDSKYDIPGPQTREVARTHLSTLTMAPTAPVASSAVRRVALIIGNSKYSAVDQLSNPARDASGVADVLRQVGFQSVVLKLDLSREQMLRALTEFTQVAEGADWALIYFAGHGIEIGGTNYLIPIDARLETDRAIQIEAISLDQLLAATEGAKKLHLIILDACRNNPFTRSLRRTMATRSIGRGLAPVEPDVGTLVVYAAKHGALAMDGDDVHSPFASALIREMLTPGVEIRKMFDLVRDDVIRMTSKKQIPFMYGSLSGHEDFYFVFR